MKTNRPSRRGMFAVTFDWTLDFMLRFILMTLALLALILAALKVASAPRVTRMLAAIGAGALLLLTFMETRSEDTELHKHLYCGYTLVFISYSLHWFARDIRKAEIIVRRWTKRIATYLRDR